MRKSPMQTFEVDIEFIGHHKVLIFARDWPEAHRRAQQIRLVLPPDITATDLHISTRPVCREREEGQA
jgi:hypothetical protein